MRDDETSETKHPCEGLNYKQTVADVKPEGSRKFSFTFSSASVDRDRDVITQDGIDLAAFKRNPVVLWAHDYNTPPIARVGATWYRDGKLMGSVEFPPAGTYALADTVHDLVKTGFINATSIGFIPQEWTYDETRGGINFQKIELMELSIVPVPSNRDALLSVGDGKALEPLMIWAKSFVGRTAPVTPPTPPAKEEPKSMPEPEPEPTETKGVVPANASDQLAPRGTAWTAPTLADFTDKTWDDLPASEKRHVAGHFAWADGSPASSFGGLKLPHHRASDGAVVFRGVAAAAARLNQSQIPDADVDKVKAHLRAHYKQFDAEVPDALKSADEIAEEAEAKLMAREKDTDNYGEDPCPMGPDCPMQNGKSVKCPAKSPAPAAAPVVEEKATPRIPTRAEVNALIRDAIRQSVGEAVRAHTGRLD